MRPIPQSRNHQITRSPGRARVRLSGAEVIVASAIVAIATVVLSSYVPYRIGWRVSPVGVLLSSVAAAAAIAFWLNGVAEWRAGEVFGCVGAMIGVAAPLHWMARPHLLPIGAGPDLTHHMVLINYIERQWRLIFDPSLVPYLGDMIYYTPGSHLLVALAGAWTGRGGLHAVHPILVTTVALKAGVLFCVAQRVLPAGASRTPLAVATALLPLFPHAYFLGSFIHDSFWAQVVAELFACAAWWALVVWDDAERRPWAGAMILFAIFGAATFVTWPIWTGPIVFAAVILALWRPAIAARTRFQHLALALVPVAAIALVHSVGRLEWLRMAGTAGAVLRPSVSAVGWPFVTLSAIGTVAVVRDRRGRTVLTMLMAIAVQALALFVLAKARGADTPYLALKMMYLAIYPLAIAAGVALAVACRLRRIERVAWVVPAVMALLAARQVATMPRSKPIVTESLYQAGRWARTHVDPACVDYLVADSNTGYWLHLAVLDNPRTDARMAASATFDPQKAIERWIDTDGLPFGIVDDVNGFSRALFSDADTLAQFGPSMVIKRRGKAICADR